ncbi:MAG: protein nirF [Gammaproteobacteria bacterium]|nr:protein nirF [Gammaproteobacteria bacterium]
MIKFLLIISIVTLSACSSMELRGTGDLAVVIERATGSVQILDTSSRTSIGQVKGLGDLSHASIVYSRDARYAYVFGRDGGLTKIDILEQKIVKRVIQSGNSIGGAISQDGRLLAVSNYTPGGVKVFNSSTLELIADIPAVGNNGLRSKVVGLVDAPGQQFVFSLYDAGEIWIVDFSDGKPEIRKFTDIGLLPYDGLISGNGRFYIAGLFGEDGLALLDLWNIQDGVKRILSDYGKGQRKMPVYKMPHLEGWAITDNYAFLPAVGRNTVLVVDRNTWKEVKQIPVHGQPIFVMSRPDGRQVWVNYAFPNNDTVEVIDTLTLEKMKTLKPGKAVLHMEFTPRGEHVWISARDNNWIKVFDTDTFEVLTTLPAKKPSGIFMSSRAHQTGL